MQKILRKYLTKLSATNVSLLQRVADSMHAGFHFSTSLLLFFTLPSLGLHS